MPLKFVIALTILGISALFTSMMIVKESSAMTIILIGIGIFWLGVALYYAIKEPKYITRNVK